MIFHSSSHPSFKSLNRTLSQILEENQKKISRLAFVSVKQVHIIRFQLVERRGERWRQQKVKLLPSSSWFTQYNQPGHISNLFSNLHLSPPTSNRRCQIKALTTRYLPDDLTTERASLTESEYELTKIKSEILFMTNQRNSKKTVSLMNRDNIF